MSGGWGGLKVPRELAGRDPPPPAPGSGGGGDGVGLRFSGEGPVVAGGTGGCGGCGAGPDPAAGGGLCLWRRHGGSGCRCQQPKWPVPSAER